MSLITSPARISPAADGTNDTDPGIDLLPCGSSSVTPSGVSASSSEYTTYNRSIPRFLSSLRMIRANGQNEVL